MDYGKLFRLDGRTAVLVGAGSGIGREATRGLAAAGATVICADINESAAAETAGSAGSASAGTASAGTASAGTASAGTASPYLLDARDPAAVGARRRNSPTRRSWCSPRAPTSASS